LLLITLLLEARSLGAQIKQAEEPVIDTRKAIDGQAMILMLFLCIIWGLQQVVLKAAAVDIAPIMQIALRSGIAAILVGLLMFFRGERMSLADGTWRPGLLVGFLFALEYLFLGEGLRHTSASHAVVFLYTAPVFAALGLHWKLSVERLQLFQWVGILLAFAGIVIAFFWRSSQPMIDSSSNILWGDFLALLAAMAWGATTVVIRCSSLARTSVTQTLLYQLVGAFTLLMLAAIGLGQTGFNHTRLAWGSLLFQTLVVSFASFLVWFWLLRNYLASRLGVFSFMTPLFGIAFGVWLLNEPLEASFLAGALLVIAGIVLVSGYGWLKQVLGGVAKQS
jgi:drug/metabolite transporter (DMT)-like permease